MMGGIDIAPTKVAAERGHKMQLALYDNGLHVKTTGDTAILAPPYIMTSDQIDQMIDTMRSTMKAM